MRYIVASGNGYFRRFVNEMPLMISDPVLAKRMTEDQAKSIAKVLDSAGLEGYITPVREVGDEEAEARIDYHERMSEYYMQCANTWYKIHEVVTILSIAFIAISVIMMFVK